MGGTVDPQAVAAIEAEVLERAAQVHAAQAALADSLARFDAVDGWHGAGIRSLGHWADINLGLASRAASRFGAAAARLTELPQLRAAFAEGAVSLDKVLAVAPVATAASDEKFTVIARAGTVTQVQRICAAYRRLDDDESPDAFDERHQRRGVSVAHRDSGLIRIIADLEPDEAAVVLAALDARVEDAWRHDQPISDDDGEVEPGPPVDYAVRRADALVELATDGLVEGPDPIVRGERVEVRVHVDAEVLAGTRGDGICAIDGIGAVAPAIVRRLLCDAKVCTVTEQLDGILNLGRTRYTINRRQRRALHHRDRGCRYPGCPLTRFVEAHHVLPWEHDGRTDMDNLMLLCAEHHRLFHEGAYTITPHGNGNFTFHRPDGRTIAPPPLRAKPATGPPPPGIPRAEGGGARYDLDLTLDALQYEPR